MDVSAKGDGGVVIKRLLLVHEADLIGSMDRLQNELKLGHSAAKDLTMTPHDLAGPGFLVTFWEGPNLPDPPNKGSYQIPIDPNSPHKGSRLDEQTFANATRDYEERCSAIRTQWKKKRIWIPASAIKHVEFA